MASRLRVDEILPSVGNNIAIGTAIGSVSFANATYTVGTGASVFSPTTNTLAFGTNNTEKLRIDSSGNVGIGTDNPTRRLHVQSPGSTSNALFGNSENNNSIEVTRTGSTASYFQVQTYTNICNVVGGPTLTFRTSDPIGSASTERLRITSGGNVEIANGNLVFSTAGTGIDFSATADGSGTMGSELLDDYEEGDWTPVLRGRTTAGTTVNNRTAVGKYTKIGRMVNVVCDIDQTCTSGSGDMQISGLPYNAHTGPYVRFMGPIHWERMPFAYSDVQIVAFLNDNNDYVWIGSSRSNTTGDLLDITSNRTAMQFSITYMTD